MSELRDQVRAEKEYLVNLRRDFHRYPELALQEKHTSEVIERELERFGISHTRVGATGVLGVFHGTQRGRGVVALRADIDALPIQETNDVEYRSQTDGIVHACDTMPTQPVFWMPRKSSPKIATASARRSVFCFSRQRRPAKVLLILLKPGYWMARSAFLGLHSAPDLPIRTIGIKPRLNNAAVNHFRILWARMPCTPQARSWWRSRV